MNETKRRRLELLPEVLPRPQTVGVTTSSVRSRTLARLKVLAAVGAASVAASCSGKTVGGSSGSSGSSGDPFLPEGGADGGEDAYGVVDPLPNPSCFNNQTPTATASYLDQDAGFDAGEPNTNLVEVLLSFKQSGVVLGSFTSSDGAVFVEGASTSTGARLVVRVAKGTPQAHGRLQVSCAQGPTALELTFTLGASAVSVAVSEY